MAKVLPTPEKSAADRKEYRAIELDNGLVALLIADEQIADDGDDLSEGVGSDDEIDEEGSGEEEGDDDEPQRSRKFAAAAMVVHAGSFHENKNCQGLAHFCEHMIFMGSEKYPDENELDSFLSRNSGGTNAYTELEYTNYHFDVAPDKFHQALDIWAQFFINPLMKKDSVEREVTAVHSEFEMAKTDDGCRKMLIIAEAVMKHDHPQSLFSWGNKRSLCTEPEAMGISAYDALHTWYPRNYSSKFMKLVVQSPHTLDELQSWITEIFSAIPSRDLSKPLDEPIWNDGSAFKGQMMSRLIKYFPINDGNVIDIVWTLKPKNEFYRVKPLHYYGWLIGHEGEGSILSYLKKQDWAHEIYAGNSGQGSEENNYHSEFAIQFRLTDSGLENWENVVGAVMGYLEMLRNIDESEQLRIFEEIKKIEAINWATKEDKKSQQNCIDSAENMLKYPPKRWLDGDQLIFEYDPEVLSDVLKEMRSDNFLVILSSKCYETTVDRTEKWMEGKYSIEDLKEDQKTKWSDANAPEYFRLPSSNRFLAENITLKEDEDSINWEVVRKVEENIKGELWFKADGIFKLPRAMISLILRSNIPFENAKNNAMYDFFPFILTRVMAEVAYDAETALLGYHFDPDSNGLNIKVDGLNDKLHFLLEEIISQIINFNPSETEFQSLKTQFMENFKNVVISPEELAKDLRLSLMQSTKFSLLERRKSFEEITKEDFLEFIGNYRKECYLTMHIQGNYYESEATELFAKTLESFIVENSIVEKRGKRKRRKLDSNPLSKRHTRTIRLPEKPQIVKVLNMNPMDVNSEYIVYWQVGPMTIKDYARHDLLLTIMEEPCFDNLRTKKTLGYSVYPMLRDTFGICGFSISVSSQKDKFTIEQVHQHVLEFINDFKTHLDKLPDDKFEEHRAGLIDAKQSDDTKLKQLFNRWNSEIASCERRFDRLKTEIKYLEKLKKKDIIKAYKNSVLKNQRIVVVAVEGNDPDAAKEAKEEELSLKNIKPGDVFNFEEYEQIEDLSEARKQCGFYPVTFLNKNE